MGSKLVLVISTLAFGTALAAVPALAQTDRGGQRAGGGASAPAQGYKYPAGRSMNDGGFVAQQQQQSNAQGPARSGPTPRGRVQAQAQDNRSYYDYAGPNFGGPMQPSSAAQACAVRFRSYDPATGTFMGFDGIRHPCP